MQDTLDWVKKACKDAEERMTRGLLGNILYPCPGAPIDDEFERLVLEEEAIEFFFEHYNRAPNNTELDLFILATLEGETRALEKMFGVPA